MLTSPSEMLTSPSEMLTSPFRSLHKTIYISKTNFCSINYWVLIYNKIATMPSRTDWLSRNHESLYNQANRTTDYLTGENLTRFGITGVLLTWYNNEYIPRHIICK
jgi:hypothetical protein